jgi:hypothetical protein
MFFVGFIFNVVLLLVLYNFVTKLEGKDCGCSDEVRRPLVKQGALLLLALNVLAIVASMLSEKMTKVLLLAIALVSFPYFILYASYLIRLRAIGCECSDMPQRNVLFWYTMYGIGLYTISILALIVMLVFKGDKLKNLAQKMNKSPRNNRSK